MKSALIILAALTTTTWLSSCTTRQANRIENRYDRREDRIERREDLYRKMPGRRGGWY